MHPQFTPPEHVALNVPVQPYVGFPNVSFPVNSHVLEHVPEHAPVVVVVDEVVVLELPSVVVVELEVVVELPVHGSGEHVVPFP